MTPEELHALLTRWLVDRKITQEEREKLRDKYLEVENLPAKTTCTTCPTFWLQVSVSLRIYLRQFNLKVSVKEAKYKINNEAGVLRLPFLGKTIVNEGEESKEVVILTDELGDELKKDYPELFEDNGGPIIENVNYDPKAAEEEEKPKTATKSAPAAKPATTITKNPATGEPKTTRQRGPNKPKEQKKDETPAPHALTEKDPDSGANTPPNTDPVVNE